MLNSPSTPMPLKHVLLALLIAAIWGSNFIVMKLGSADIPPLLFVAIRSMLAAFPGVFLLPKPQTSWKSIIILGTLIGVLKFSFLICAIKIGLSPGIASLLGQTQIFFTALFAHLFLNEKPKVRQVIGMAIAFIGIGFIAVAIHSPTNLIGIILVLFSAISWGSANIYTKRMGKVNMLHLMVWISLIPPIPLFGFSILMEGIGPILHALTHLTNIAILALCFAAWISGVLGYTLWGYLLSHHKASEVAPYALLVPVFGMAGSSLVLGEIFTLPILVGSFLIIAGLITNQWRARVKSPTILVPETPLLLESSAVKKQEPPKEAPVEKES